jgi:hypothetical protein
MEIFAEGQLMAVREYKKKDGSMGCQFEFYVPGDMSDLIKVGINGNTKAEIEKIVGKRLRAKLELKHFDGRPAFSLKGYELKQG